MFDYILAAFGLKACNYTVQSFGSGLINQTLKVSGNGANYILQQVNTNVFKLPYAIAENISQVEQYLKQIQPSYLFVAPLPSVHGSTLVQSATGNIYRLFPFVEGSHTVDFISDEKQAFEAAKQFGRFTFLLKDFAPGKLNYTLPDFHNLNLRYDQLIEARQNAQPERLLNAANEIELAYHFDAIVQTYNQIIINNEIPLRVIHHDTKISNVLFDDRQNGLCVIDLDTVMPGYYLSDVGDMMRTYLSPANEEEIDLSKIYIRENIFKAIYDGYFSEMGDTLTTAEKQHFIFAGKMMIYMQALRFLTDYLNNDAYYGSRYPGHNLARAQNQFKLLTEYENLIERFKQITN